MIKLKLITFPTTDRAGTWVCELQCDTDTGAVVGSTPGKRRDKPTPDDPEPTGCTSCSDRPIPRPDAKGMARGARSLIATHVTGKYRARDDVAKARWSACQSCDQFVVGWCDRCDCILPAKVLDTRERCPMGKW